MCFGRPSSVVENLADSCLDSSGAGLSYLECRYIISGLIARTLRAHTDAQVLALQATEAISTITKITGRGLPHIRSKDHGRTVQTRLEYLALQIHLNFGLTYLRLRIGLLPNINPQASRPSLIQDCKASCILTLQAFLDMRAGGGQPERSWVFLFNAMSSALLLGFFGDQIDLEAKKLQKSFLKLLDKLNEEAKSAGSPACGFQLRYTRAVEKLRNMCEDPSDDDSGPRHSPGAGNQTFARNDNALEGQLS